MPFLFPHWYIPKIYILIVKGIIGNFQCIPCAFQRQSYKTKDIRLFFSSHTKGFTNAIYPHQKAKTIPLSWHFMLKFFKEPRPIKQLPVPTLQNCNTGTGKTEDMENLLFSFYRTALGTGFLYRNIFAGQHFVHRFYKMFSCNR